MATDVKRKEAVADLNGRRTRDIPEAQDMGFERERGWFEELHDFMQEMQKVIAELHAALVAEKTARVKHLLEVIALSVRKEAQI